MTERPYMMMGIEALERLAQTSKSDAEVLDSLIAELHHRKNLRAQRLRSRLEGSDVQEASESATSGQLGTSRAASVPAAAVGNQDSPDTGGTRPPAISAEEHSSLLRRYESLRTTFTAESELLARWGMTPALPEDLQELVFSEWRKRLADGGGPAWLSAEALAQDRGRIAQERAIVQDTFKAHGASKMRPSWDRPQFTGENL